jgi:hypothetical protein
MNRAIEAAVRRFPASFSLAYGSAVFPQAARGIISRDVRAPARRAACAAQLTNARTADDDRRHSGCG